MIDLCRYQRACDVERQTKRSFQAPIEIVESRRRKFHSFLRVKVDADDVPSRDDVSDGREGDCGKYTMSRDSTYVCQQYA